MTYILIPGAGGVALYWYLVEAELERRGHEAVSVELPADDASAGFNEYADAVVEAARDANDVTLVAQSLGGFTAPLVAERMPVTRIVFVNAMIPRVGESAGQWWDNTGQPKARRDNDAAQGRDPEAEFDLFTYFLHDLPAAQRDAVMATGKDQADTPMQQPYPLTRWPAVPMHVITATDDRFFPVGFQRRVAQERLGVTPDEIPGGHLVALSRPRALVAQILRC